MALGAAPRSVVCGCAINPPRATRARHRRGKGRGLLALSLLAICPLQSGCAPQSQAEVPQAKVPHSRPTIVSLNPCTDAILAEVADRSQVLALSHYSADPRASSLDPAVARRFAFTRGTVEEVLALRPDLVVDGSFIDPATAAAYRRLGLRLETFGMAANVPDARAQVLRLAALAGHPERGAALVARIDAALAEAKPAPGSPPVATLMWEPGGIVPGDATLIADLMRYAGLANFAAARGLGQGQQLPLERVLADPPQLVITAGADRALAHPVLAYLTGTRRARFAPGLLYCGGPTIIRAAAQLAQVRRAYDAGSQ
ncbi:ABC transporter substrate-binding protein [Novosphingobium sp.]|uniref:ABC transporter substrate-binding protein n=1 Tax=Novosphingobium sp. TaxID=1874826 RepID=UPI0038BB6219